MAKGKTATVFFCQNCGYESTKWLGQCPGCREWNTFVEETIDKTELKEELLKLQEQYNDPVRFSPDRDKE